MLATKLGLDWEKVQKLQPLMVARDMTPKELLENVEQHLHSGVYTRDEIVVCHIKEPG